jgi:quercetin dioxygenase-like cupin family protein
MEHMNRRSALALGLAATAATPLAGLATPAAAKYASKDYGPTEGKEIAPGVRVVEVGKWDSIMTGTKSIVVVDVVFQPGAADVESVMDNDMLCQITSGEFKINKKDKEFTVKEGDYYTCAKGQTDHATNTGKGVGVHRVAILIPA